MSVMQQGNECSIRRTCFYIKRGGSLAYICMMSEHLMLARLLA